MPILFLQEQDLPILFFAVMKIINVENKKMEIVILNYDI